MFVTRLEHPPMHASKYGKFKVHEEDYFGGYDKLQKPIQSNFSKKKHEISKEEQSLVIIN